jgi:hypothetical protein
MGKMSNASNLSLKHLKGRDQRGKSWRKWENNIRMDVRGIGWKEVSNACKWLRTEIPLAGCCEHDKEPSGYVRGGEFLDWVTVSFSRRTLLRGVSQLVITNYNVLV